MCPSSGAQVQPGPVRQQALPGPGEDREEQQARGSDPGQDPRLERGHGPRGGLLRRARGVQHRLVRRVPARFDLGDPSQPPPCFSTAVTTAAVVSDRLPQMFSEVDLGRFDPVPMLRPTFAEL